MATTFNCLYGPSGTGKTEGAIARAIEALKRVDFNGTVRVYVGDGSKGNYLDTGLVDEGIIKICDYSGRPWPLTVMLNASQGYWPKTDDIKAPLEPLSPEDYNSTVMWIFEGLSTAGEYIMGDTQGGLAEQSGRGIKVGQDSPVQLRDVLLDNTGKAIAGSGPGTTFGGNPLAHYNFAQRRVLGWLERSRALPGEVIWTAHEKAGDDDLNGEKIIGPECAGKALSHKLPRYFNNTLHFTTATKIDKKQDGQTGRQINVESREFRLYTRDHYDPDGLVLGVKYKAVNRCRMPELLPDYLTGGKPGENINQFFEILEDAKKRYFDGLGLQKL